MDDKIVVKTEQLAKLLVLTERRVQQLGKMGVLANKKRGEWYLVPSIQGYINYLQTNRTTPQSNEGASVTEKDLLNAEVRFKNAQADEKEMSVAQKRNELVPITEVEACMMQAFMGLRNSVVGFPAQMVPLLWSSPTEEEAIRLMNKEVRDWLNTLAKTAVQGLEMTFNLDNDELNMQSDTPTD